MSEDRILFPKRSKPTDERSQGLEINSEPRKMPLRVINRQNRQIESLRNERNKTSWSERDQEELIGSLLQEIVRRPYLRYRWNSFKEQKILAKICEKTGKLRQQCFIKMSEIEGVHEQKYQDMKMEEFLMVYWRREGLDKKKGEKMMEKVKEMKVKKSEHMRMLQQRIQMTRRDQRRLDQMYEMMMR